jgi:hypothetical protein
MRFVHTYQESVASLLRSCMDACFRLWCFVSGVPEVAIALLDMYESRWLQPDYSASTHTGTGVCHPRLSSEIVHGLVLMMNMFTETLEMGKFKLDLLPTQQ